MKHLFTRFNLLLFFLFFTSFYFAQKVIPIAPKTEKSIDSLIALGEYNKAIDACNAALKSDKKNFSLQSKRAFIHLKKEDFRAAISEYTKLLAKPTECSACMQNLAKAYSETGKKDSAMQWINKAIALQDKNGEFYLTRAWINMSSLNDSLKNLNDLSRGIELLPVASSYVTRARYYYSLGYFQQAKENVYSALKLDENNFEANFLNFLIQSAALDQSAASRYAEKCFSIDPKNPKSVVLQALISGARDTTGKIRIIDSVCSKNDKVAVLHLFRALYYRNTGITDGFCGSINYGFTKLKTREDTVTYAVFGREAAGVCDPKDLTYYTTRASALLSNPETIEKGIAILRQAQVALPGSCVVPFQLAYFLTRLNKYDEAYGEIQKSFGNYNRVEVFKFWKLYNYSPEVASMKEKEFRFNQMFILNQCLAQLVPDAKEKTGYLLLMQRAMDSSLVLVNAIYDNNVRSSYFSLASYCFFLAKNEEKQNYFMEQGEKLVGKIPSTYLLRAQLLFENACPGTFEEKFTGDPYPYLNVKSKAAKPDIQKLNKALAYVETLIILLPDRSYFYYLRGMIKWNLGKKDFCADVKKAYDMGLDRASFMAPTGCKF